VVLHILYTVAPSESVQGLALAYLKRTPLLLVPPMQVLLSFSVIVSPPCRGSSS